MIRTIEDLYEETKKKLENKRGKITVDFAGKTHVYKGKDVIGNCLQEWLPVWFEHIGIKVTPNENTQSFPDFTAKIENINYDIEIKVWNYDKPPAFDLANFASFISSTYDNPQKLDAFYIVLGYDVKEGGFEEGFTVKKVYLKRIWELTSATKANPIGLQVKRGQVYAIRPYNFRSGKQSSFTGKDCFIEAVKEAFIKYPNENISFTADEWAQKVRSYT